MNFKSGHWRWAILAGNSLLILAASLAPVNLPVAIAVDGKHADNRATTVEAAVPRLRFAEKRVEAARPKLLEEVPAPPALEPDDDPLLPLGQFVFRDELDQAPPPRAVFLLDEEPGKEGNEKRGEQLLPAEVRIGRKLKALATDIAGAMTGNRRQNRLVAKAEVGRVGGVEQAIDVIQLPAIGKVEPALEKKIVLKKALKETGPVNPIGKLFRDVLPPPAGPLAKKKFLNPAGVAPAVRPAPFPIVVDKPNPARKDPARRRNAADPSVAHDNKKAEWMQHALQQIELKNWKPALESLQRIVEHPEDALYYRADKEWVSIRLEAQRVLGGLPPEAHEIYRTQYNALAQQFLNRAIQSNDVELLSRVARLYFHTPAGYEATDRLGNVHLDRGEFGLAGRLFHSLWQIHAPPAQTRSWRLKALLAFRKGGQTSWADMLWQEIAAGLPPTLEIGGKPVDPRKWLEAQGVPPAIVMEPLAEWPIFFGNKERTGRPVGSQPLLLNRWTQATTQVEPLRQNLESLADDEADKGNPALPVFMPIMVGDKIAYRTFNGVQVVTAATGKPLWRTESDLPLEEIFSARQDAPNHNLTYRRRNVLQGNVGYQPGMDPQPLSNIVYRNSNFGQLSSDGTRLFVLDDPQLASARLPGNYYGEDGTQSAQPQANTLTAYDLATGGPVWEAGGDDFGEEFQLPLAGHFFFGAPLFDGNELLLVGEQLKKNEIRLFGLDPANGRVKWSQLVAVAEVGIARDIFRRWWSAPTATAEGVIVTPTTANWIVGVDRVTHSLLWGYHFPRRTSGDGRNEEIQAMVQGVPLAARWYPSPPMIAQQRVIYAPQEANLLLCLDLFTGKELWQIPRNEYLAVAGVFDESVLLIGKNSLSAVGLRTGQVQWKTTTSPIVGRGTAVGERYYLPCASGELWQINISNGAVVEKLFLSNTAGAAGSPTNGVLGNLSFYRGMLLSLTPRDLTAFEQHDNLHSQIVAAMQKNPHDPWANLRQAEIHLLRREAAPAVASIGNILEREVPADLLERYREVSIDVLTVALRSDFNREDLEAIKRLEQLSQTPRQRLNYRRLLAERSFARKQYTAAFDAYLSLAEEPGEMQIATGEHGNIKVRLSAWLQGQFSDLWKAIPEAQRGELDARVRDRAAAVLTLPPETQWQFVNLFRDHPAARDVTRQVIERLAGQRDFLQAERLLLRWRRSEDRALAAEATERLARLMREFDLRGDAVYFYSELESRFGDVKLAGGQTGAELVGKLRTSGNFPVAAALVDWSHRTPRVDRLGSNYSDQQRQDLSRSGSRMPFFRQHLVQMYPVDQRLEIVRLDTGDPYWSLPLRSRQPQGNHERVAAESSDHQMTVLHQGVLHGLSPVERKVLWTRTLEQRTNPIYYHNPYYSGYGSSIAPMQSFGNSSGLSRRRSRMNFAMPQSNGSGLSFSNSEIVGYQGRRTFTVLDAGTGDVLWTTDRVRQGTRILAGTDIVCLIAPNTQSAQILRAVDGQPVTTTHLGVDTNGRVGVESWRSVIDLVGGHDLILTSPEGGSSTRIKRIDPTTNREIWSVDVPRSSSYSLLENDWLAILQQDGWYKVLDLESGKLKNLAQIPADVLQNRNEVYSVIDYDNLYLFINNKPNQNYYYDQGIPMVKASGAIYTFDLETCKQRWTQQILGQNLLMERLDYLPALVFATRRFEQRNRTGYWGFYLQVLDKKTGRKLLDESSQSQNGFQALWLHPADQAIELRGYNERIRITAPAGPVAPAGAAIKPEAPSSIPILLEREGASKKP